jgi:hypothetical protein
MSAMDMGQNPEIYRWVRNQCGAQMFNYGTSMMAPGKTMLYFEGELMMLDFMRKMMALGIPPGMGSGKRITHGKPNKYDRQPYREPKMVDRSQDWKTAGRE